MLNQLVLIGRIVREIELKETESGIKVCNMTIAVPRSFKNEEGVYDTDFVDVTLWKGVAENTAEYCHKGDLIGIKGRIQTRIIEKEDGIKENKIEVIAEKVTFLSTSKQKKEDD